MLPFETIITIDKTLTLPAYQQVANTIIKLIQNGIIPPGSLLPGTRDLGRMIKLHRKTIIAAYNELDAQGWTKVIPKKGYLVAESLPEISPKKWGRSHEGYTFNSKMPSLFYKINKTNDFVSAKTSPASNIIIDDGHPDTRLAPMHLLNREYQSRMKQQHMLKKVSVTLAPGSFKLRETLINYMSQTRGIQARVQNILITHGAQMSIYIAASLLLKPGSYVLVGEPGYHVANQVFEYLGARIIRIPVDRDGMDIHFIEKACQKHTISMLYLIPHHHHPTTVTLSPERRMGILEMAERFNFSIVEDDYDYDFHYSSSPYLPLAGGNHHNRVIYIGSFSKSLSTSIRIGFMIAASDFIEQAVYLRRLIELKGDNIMEDALAALINSGDITRHLKKANKIYSERRDHLCSLLETHLKGVVSFDKPDGGMAVWTIFHKKHQLEKIAIKAARQGLFINDGKLFDNSDTNYNALRFGFASLTPLEMNEAVRIISCSL